MPRTRNEGKKQKLEEIIESAQLEMPAGASINNNEVWRVMRFLKEKDAAGVIIYRRMKSAKLEMPKRRN